MRHDTWVVFDIDGTVADFGHRHAHIEQAVPDWEAFFAASSLDEPLHDGVALARTYAADHLLLWLTGRPERYRDITATWLGNQGLPTAPLHMRTDDDLRPAHEFKSERVRRLSAEYDIALIVDDDACVVAALREAGWPVRYVAWMTT
jgi:phosphoglycolate phosphatase-like HAD superfamily hydrolase